MSFDSCLSLKAYSIPLRIGEERWREEEGWEEGQKGERVYNV